MNILDKIKGFIMEKYTVKSTELTAQKIAAVSTTENVTTVTFDDGLITAGIASCVVGDYAILLPSGNYQFINAEFFELIAKPKLSFEQALAAIKAGQSVKRASSDVIVNMANEVITFIKDDIEALDYEIVN